uniref:Uncharacterized protein LOC111134233 n=1 Tax=Crassostrea virginica TaxID=6565 RepID=A0A8B8EGH9_CRAVI|nr:uncharacterized protein LOC111134233 [Crassostrea virginica]
MFLFFLLASGILEVLSYWHPHQHTSWNDVIGETHINTGIHGDVYVIDLFEHHGLIPELIRKGKKVVCYFSAGTAEEWRPDYSDFPRDALGDPDPNWERERWVDIRDTRVWNVMARRIALAKQYGCHGVDPDNVDGYTNNPGFQLSYDNQITFNRFLANEAHKHELAIGLKNDLLQIHDLVHYFDFAINESCEKYRYNSQSNCALYQPFFDARKAVFHIEYVDSTTEAHSQRSAICSHTDRPSDMNTIIKVSLNNFKVGC